MVDVSHLLSINVFVIWISTGGQMCILLLTYVIFCNLSQELYLGQDNLSSFKKQYKIFFPPL